MRTSDKNRYLRAVRREEQTEIPFQETQVDIEIAEKLLGRPLPMVRSFELPIADYVELNLRCGNDLIYFSHVWELGRHNVFDARGHKHYVDGTIKTRNQLQDITYPDLGAIERRLEELLKAIDGTGLGVMYTPSQAPFIVTTAVGYEDYYLALVDNPAFIHEFQKIAEEFCRRELERALTYPIDVVQVGAVISTKHGPLTSRELIEEFEYPSLRHRIGMVRAAGLPVSLHFDGDATPFLEDFIAMGVNVLNPVEPCCAAMDIYDLKRRYGDRLALHGNIDVSGVLTYGTPEEVAAEVRQHIDGLSHGGGYIVASSHDINELVPLENFEAMRDTAHSYHFRPNR